MSTVLVVDDDEVIRTMLSEMAMKLGHLAHTAGTVEEAYRKASEEAPDIVFLDVRLPDGTGLDLLPRLREIPSEPEVIIITGLGDPDGAELAIKNGAWDYIRKSASIKEIALPFIRALQYREEKKARKPVKALHLDGIIGSSQKIRACLDATAQMAASEGNVLITGETGTGKELFARAIHENSSRAGKPFVVVDCTTLPETLVESVLFGHEKGAFTGAEKAQEGLVKQAHGGTLFLDEIGELPLVVQRSFLRVLQERRFRPVGARQEVESKFRLISATNRDVDEMVKAGHFRLDLSYRIRTLSLRLPPLREHIEDAKDLALYYMQKFADRYGMGPKGFAPEFFDALHAYDWPGNVRELVNAVEQAMAVAKDEPTLFPKHLPTEIRVKIARSSITRDTEGPTLPSPGRESIIPTIDEYRESMEKRYLQDLVLRTGGKIREACKTSGLSRSRLYALLKKHGIQPKP